MVHFLTLKAFFKAFFKDNKIAFENCLFGNNYLYPIYGERKIKPQWKHLSQIGVFVQSIKEKYIWQKSKHKSYFLKKP